MDPKIRYEIVPGRRPYIAEEDRAAFAEEGRRINEADAEDGTNQLLDAMIMDEADGEEW